MKYYLFDNIRFDGGALQSFDTFEEAREHINMDSQAIVYGTIVWGEASN